MAELGFEIIGTCEARTSSMVAPARSAMNGRVGGGIALSLVAMRYHYGIVFQAGSPDSDSNASCEEGSLLGLHLIGDLAGHISGEGVASRPG